MATNKSALGADPLTWLNDSDQAGKSLRSPGVDTNQPVSEVPKEVFMLDEALTVATVASTKQKLLEHYDKDLVIDLGTVSMVDTAGIQLLLSLVSSKEDVRLINASDKFEDACNLLGLADVFSLSE